MGVRGLIAPGRGGHLRAPGLRARAGGVLTDESQVMGDDAPTYPALHASHPMMAAAVQAKAAFEHADASFDPGPEAAGAAEPALAFVRLPLGRPRPGFGQGDVGYPGLLRHL